MSSLVACALPLKLVCFHIKLGVGICEQEQHPLFQDNSTNGERVVGRREWHDSVGCGNSFTKKATNVKLEH